MESVVVGFEGAETHGSVYAYAAWICRGLSAPVALVHTQPASRRCNSTDLCGVTQFDAHHTVVNDLINRCASGTERLPRQVQSAAEQARQFFRQVGVECVGIHTYPDALPVALNRIPPHPKLLVVGRPEARGSGAAYFGGSLEALIARANQPVLICPAAFKTPRSVMIAYDGSTKDEVIFEFMASCTLFQTLDVHLVMVGPQAKASIRLLNETAAHLAEFNIAARVELCQGRVEPMLHAYQAINSIDLMVMGAFGFSSLKRFVLGSTTSQIINAPSDKPILVFP